MTKLLVLSDPHITEAGETIIGLDTLARFELTLAAAVTDHPDATALILLGDLAHHGSVAAYQRLRGALAKVQMPVIPLMGNHDRRDHFLEVFPDAPQTVDGHIQTALDVGPYRLITLDTLDGPPYPAGHHSGWLCPHRLAWLEAALTDARGRPVIVVAHHPAFDTGIVGMDAIKLRNGDVLLEMLAAHGAATLVSGHIHRTISGVAKGVPWAVFKSTGHQCPLDLITPDSSISVDEPPAYGLVVLGDDGIVVHSRDMLGQQSTQHDPTSSTPSPPD